MKKVVSVSLVLTSLLYSGTLDIKKGWNNVGSSVGFDVQNKFGSMPEIQSVWRYNSVTSKWEFYSSDSAKQSTAKDAGYGAIAPLSNYSAIWVQASADKSIEDFDNYTSGVSVFTPTTVQKYDKRYFGYGTYDNKVAFGTSEDGVNWKELFSVAYSDTYYSWQSEQFINSDNRASFITQVRDKESVDGNTVYSSKLYGIIYKDGTITQTEMANTANGYVDFVYNDIFTKYDDNNTQIVLASVRDYNNNDNSKLYIYETGDTKWNLIKTIDSYYGDYSDLNYEYKSRYNANNEYVGEYKYLKSFAVFDAVDNKTNIYDATNNYNISISLDGRWGNKSSYITDSNRYNILVRQNYNRYSDSKEIAIIHNGSLESDQKLDHTVRTVGLVYRNNSQELYAFTHDEIGENLYIYKSTDDGDTWSLFKTVDNFNYQIDYVNSISYNSDTESLNCQLTVNEYNQRIESTDDLATWSLVKTNARVNVSASTNASNPEKEKWIKRPNPDGSFTLIPKN